MKKIVLGLVVLVVSVYAFAAPFGLTMGMTLDEIADECDGKKPRHVENDCYLIMPSKSHPLFEYYLVYVNDKTGLYKIRAVSSSITTNRYGTELQNSFNNIKDRISKTYGEPIIIETLDKTLSSFYKGDDHWFYTLKEGSRVLYAIWEENKTPADNLTMVGLECQAISGYLDGEGQIVLYYYFENAGGVEDEQDAVF